MTLVINSHSATAGQTLCTQKYYSSYLYTEYVATPYFVVYASQPFLRFLLYISIIDFIIIIISLSDIIIINNNIKYKLLLFLLLTI